MLILTRRIGESVYIGDDVRLTVLGVRGTQVRIGINAPRDIPVHREEIYHRIKNEESGGDPDGEYDNDDQYNGNHSEGDSADDSMNDSMDDSVDDSEGDYDDQVDAEEVDPRNA